MFNIYVVMVLIISLLIGYLCGNIHGAFLIGKLFKNIDIREHGSGNSGTTNALRVFGFKLALPVFIIDFSKAFLPVFFSSNIASLLLNLFGTYMNTSEFDTVIKSVIALGVILGHNYPFVLKFKGGKGIACSVGILTAINLLCGVIYAAIIVSIIVITRYVSLGSIIASICIPLILGLLTKDYVYICLGFILMIFAVARHKANIVRLKNGTESKFGEKAKVK